jgi:magnesium transporter
MSTKSCQSAVSLARSTLRQSRPFRITPPPLYVHERTYFTRRSTSFYTNSYPQSGLSGVEIPYTPPSPATDKPTSSNNESGVHEDGRRKERKAKYLESLMDKAGELSLRCMSILSFQVSANIQGSIIDSNGEWRAEEGRYKKTELCREHDLDVRPSFTSSSSLITSPATSVNSIP